MKIGELFINLAVKGQGVVVKALGDINGKLNSIADSSIAAKAAVVGVIVGMERLTGFASQAGMDLYKFGELTGESTDELQKWQYAMGRFDVSAEEVTGSLSGVKDIMTNMKMGKGAPESMAMIAEAVGGIDTKRASNDLFYLMSKLQEFAKKAPPSIAKSALKDFGLSGNFVAGLRMMNLEKDKLSKNQIISQGEIQRLTAINKAWKDFWYTLRTMGIKFVAAEGIVGIQMLTRAFQGLMRVGKIVSGLTDKFKGLKTVLLVIAAGVAAYFAPVTAAVVGLMYLLSEFEKYSQGKENIFSKVSEGATKVVGGISDWFKGGGASNAASQGAESIKSGLYTLPSAASVAVPPATASPTGAPGGNTNTQSNTFNIVESKGPKETASEIHKMLLNTPMNAVVGGH